MKHTQFAGRFRAQVYVVIFTLPMLFLSAGCSPEALLYSFGTEAVMGVASAAFDGVQGVDNTHSTKTIAPEAGAILSKARRVSLSVERTGGRDAGDVVDAIDGATKSQLVKLGYTVVTSSPDKEGAQEPELLVTCSPILKDLSAGSDPNTAGIRSINLKVQSADDMTVIVMANIAYAKPKKPGEVAGDIGVIIGNARKK